MLTIDTKMEIIIEHIDENVFGLPSKNYESIFLHELENCKDKKAPVEFIEFLRKYGVGELSSFFRIDSNLSTHEEIYHQNIKELEGMLIFASDIGDYLYAFDTKNNWEVVDIDTSGEVFERYGDFEKFINTILDEIIEVNET